VWALGASLLIGDSETIESSKTFCFINDKSTCCAHLSPSLFMFKPLRHPYWFQTLKQIEVLLSHWQLHILVLYGSGYTFSCDCNGYC
jgi:hypothetical protein